MATATRSSRIGVQDAVLTGYFQEVSDEKHWVGEECAPVIDIDALGGNVTVPDDGAQILDLKENPNYANAVGDHSPGKQVAISDAIVNVVLEKDSFTALVPITRIIAAEKQGIGYDRRAMSRVVDYARLRHELMVMEILSDSTKYTNSSDPGNITTSSTAIVQPIREMIDAGMTDIGFAYDTVTINPDVQRALMSLDEVMSWNGIVTNVNDAPLELDRLGSWFLAMFGLNLKVSRSRWRTGAGVEGYMMGDHISLTKVSASGDSSFVNTWTNRWLADGPLTLFGMSQEDLMDPASVKYILSSLYKVQSDNADAGGILTDVLT